MRGLTRLITIFAVIQGWCISQHFNLEIEPTGVSQILIFQNSISELEPGDEIGVFDADGLTNFNDCSSQYGEVLVGTGIWEGSQTSIVGIGSIDFCAYGGVQLPGWIDNNSVVIKVWDASEEHEFEANATYSTGSGHFGDMILAISEIELIYISGCMDEIACNYNPDATEDDGNCEYPENFGWCDCEGSFEDCTGECGGNVLVDECGVCEGDGSSCAAYLESSVTTFVDESELEDIEVFEEDFETYIETQLDLPEGVVEVTDITILRDDLEIIVDFTITLTEEELAETNFENTEDISDALDEVEDDIEDGGIDFVYGCSDDTACNYNNNVNVDDGSCTYPEGTCDCDGTPVDGYCACDGSTEDDCGVCDLDPGNDNINMDCAGVCFGDSYEDFCGFCDSDLENDNDSCTGCMDPDATNYDPDAIIDCDDCCSYQVEYSIDLNGGANLISFWALPEDLSVGNVFSSLGFNAIGVIGEGLAATLLPSGVWVGSLSEISPTSGYWAKVNENAIMTIAGYPVDPEIEYNLHSGANLISFPHQSSISISDGIPDEVEPAFIGVIAEGLAATQLTPFNWVGSLSSWQGTKGYWAKVTEELSFSFDMSGISRSTKSIGEPNVNDNYNQSTEQAFYFVQIINLHSYPELDEGILQAFCNGQLVGSRKWVGEWTDIPAMGFDGSEETVGYCEFGDIPEFKLISENGIEIAELFAVVEPWESNGIFLIELLTELGQTIPTRVTLHDAYPNPFNPETNISYSIPKEMTIQLSIYDITGREIVEFSNGMRPAGEYQLIWNGKDKHNILVPSGIYTYVLQGDNFSIAKKVILLK